MRHIPIAEAGPRVQDVMLRTPRRLSASDTVQTAITAFANPREHLLLICADDVYLGAITPDTLAGASPDTELGELADADADADAVPILRPEQPISEAVEVVSRTRASRIPVVTAGRLDGLVCFNANHDCFCTWP